VAFLKSKVFRNPSTAFLTGKFSAFSMLKRAELIGLSGDVKVPSCAI